MDRICEGKLSVDVFDTRVLSLSNWVVSTMKVEEIDSWCFSA